MKDILHSENTNNKIYIHLINAKNERHFFYQKNRKNDRIFNYQTVECVKDEFPLREQTKILFYSQNNNKKLKKICASNIRKNEDPHKIEQIKDTMFTKQKEK